MFETTRRWRPERFGDGLDYVARRPGGGPAIWFGDVGPVIDGACSYSTPHGSGSVKNQEHAMQMVEAIINAR